MPSPKSGGNYRSYTTTNTFEMVNREVEHHAENKINSTQNTAVFQNVKGKEEKGPEKNMPYIEAFWMSKKA